VIRPGAGTLNWPALVMLCCVVSVAARDLVTRRIGAQVPTLLVALLAVFGMAIAGVLMMPFERWVWLGWREIFMIACAAASSTAGFYWVVEALRRGDVAVVIPFRYSLILYGVLSGIIVFGEWPDAATLLGIAIVLGAGLYTFHRERLRRN
jgi:drug/metabolite transporter (DMT)-like permease